MKKKNNEGISTDYTTYKKIKGTLNPKEPVNITGLKPNANPTATSSQNSSSSIPAVTMAMTEDGMVEPNIAPTKPEATIEPQDKATIKYLSNVKDSKTGEISKPFKIADKSYQMVRGITPEKQVVMAVYCHNDLDEAGQNIIHPIEHFEENIVKPFHESLKSQPKEDLGTNEKAAFNAVQVPKRESAPKPIEAMPKATPTEKPKDDSIGLGQYKFFLVNEKSGKFRKFKTVPEVAQASMDESEKFMTLKELKKFFESKVFGSKKQGEILEDAVTGQENDEQMQVKAKNLMLLIQKKIPANVIQTIKTPVAQREVIAAFAEMIGVPRQGLPQLIQGLKAMAATTAPSQPSIQVPPAQPVAENVVITKRELAESLNPKKVIKTIKIKDIR